MLFESSEAVAQGHPDKVADIISDAVLDACLKRDPLSRVAVETLVSHQLISIGGEVTSQVYPNDLKNRSFANAESPRFDSEKTSPLFEIGAVFSESKMGLSARAKTDSSSRLGINLDLDAIVREVITEVGYTSSTFGDLLSTFQLVSSLYEQSPDISQSIGKGKSLAAGDQGMTYGYACDDTPTFMPRSYEIARGIVEAIRENHKKYPFLGPDGKTQVSINRREKSSGSIVLSWQHSAAVSLEEVQAALRACSEEVLQKYDFNPNPFLINPSGRFVLGGPFADTGLTGRKQIVDSYGGSIPHGGGAYSGKDATKVDRSGAYMARWVAKHVVASGLAERCLVQLIFSIGKKDPLHIELDCFNTEKASLKSIRKAVLATFDFSVEGIIQDLQLRLPIFRKTASYGHFGRDGFSWETLSRLDKLSHQL